jgi:2-C-methyl-D-erythritol 4-phosphate cytidylyltransferase
MSDKAILLMSGSGDRFGSCLPKQFHPISGKKVYLHTLERIVHSALFEQIILVCHPDWVEGVTQEITPYTQSGYAKNILVVPGGKSRQESSFLGLLACGDQTTHVVIHDAVRPFITSEILKQNLQGAKKWGAVDTCIPSCDTIVHSSNTESIDKIPKRSEYWRGQTPQSFSYPLIVKAHQFALASGVENASDDCSLVLAMKHPVGIILGDEHNIKITTELDLFIAEQLLRLPQIPSLSQPQSSLQGKQFAITGGTGGIGRALQRLLEKEGAHVIPIARKQTLFHADLTSFEQTQKLFDRIYEAYGPLDGLINSVGLFKIKTLSHLSSEEIQELIATNLLSLIYSCKCAKIKEGGQILNIASSAYTKGRKDYTIYSSAKAAVVNFTQGLAEELPHLRINALAPQRTNTLMRQRSFPKEDPGNLLDPEKVAEAIIDLLKCDQLTGTTIEVRKKFLEKKV